MTHMFKVRGALLFDQIQKQHIESMISGIIIGSEIRDMQKLYDTESLVHIICSDTLVEKYNLAMEILGIEHQTYSGDELSLAGMKVLANKIG